MHVSTVLTATDVSVSAMTELPVTRKRTSTALRWRYSVTFFKIGWICRIEAEHAELTGKAGRPSGATSVCCSNMTESLHSFNQSTETNTLTLFLWQWWNDTDTTADVAHEIRQKEHSQWDLCSVSLVLQERRTVRVTFSLICVADSWDFSLSQDHNLHCDLQNTQKCDWKEAKCLSVDAEFVDCTEAALSECRRHRLPP